ncbi:siderophore-interacting protein [Clostridium botulinum]|uniref:siderophore-interacting protein n=2 Tax=Clostridium botulinum TaxID=1491 RepID=UPI001C9AD1BF|nr:siderophore-interacting protein [Clostridium botulinum]MBY6846706.1 siderophore-interacting protein [Clostridium botulinum]
MENNKFDKTEILLNSYIDFKIENENLKLEIEALKNNYDLKSIELSEKTGKTNKISNEIEDRIISNDSRIKKYECMIEANNLIMRKLENATKKLSRVEKEVIELKYFHTPILNRKEISTKISLTTAAIDNIKRRAIRKMTRFI